ncbi:hypothetical protein N7533_011978 [Penicillium manginii]|uniref:uncharacterized protein n=1 Tax=Penicillium manginii TaxID=203109 RepID=UPI002548C59A|nr:uncharacterized protein N7533_011978 [Penicillium manginii]KAJ5739194.1 hypothetical protein N7533_011978 [Penicillium manginii]
MTSSPIDISSAILPTSTSLNVKSYDSRVNDTKEKVSLQHQENLAVSEGGRDDIQLQRLGKKPVLKRDWGGFSRFLALPNFYPLFDQVCSRSLSPLLYMTPLTQIVVARPEPFMASFSAPTSGGQYHWCAMLAPKEYRNILSYITGWLSVVGWQAAFASGAFLIGTQIQGAVSLAYDSYNSKAYQGTLMMWAFLCIVFATNIVGGKFLPRLESGLLCYHILGFFGIMIPLVIKAAHKSKDQVFEEFLNGGNFPSQGLSWFVGLSGAAFAFAGGDAAVHMSEECANAAAAIPKAMMLTVVINGCLGFGMLLTMLFCSGNIQDALSSRSGYPFMEIFLQGTGSKGGALAMISVFLFAAGCSIFGMLAATSRQFWSFSRDRGGSWLGFVVKGRTSSRDLKNILLIKSSSSQVNSRHLPVSSIVLTVIIAAVLGLINIGSKLALEDILSMAVAGLYSSYLMVSILLLYRRCNGDISRFGDATSMQTNVPGARLTWGPFHVPGIFGILVNGFTVMYMVIIIFFSFWPSKMHTTASTMNYSVVGTCGVVALAIAYYAVRARHVYQGPIMEVREQE